jgi:hypothetical protein
LCRCEHRAQTLIESDDQTVEIHREHEYIGG